MLMNAQQLRLVSSTRESNAASWVLQDRLETLRNVSWSHLTNADRLKTALSDIPDCARLLPNYLERVTLVKSTDANKDSASKLIIERTADGAARTVSDSSDLSKGAEVKVDVLVSWTGKGGCHRERSYTSIISDSGVSRTNVPGFGGPTGAPPVVNGGTSSTQTDSGTSGTGTSGGSTSSSDTSGGSSSDGSTSGGTTSGGDNSGDNTPGNGNGFAYGHDSDNGNPHGNTNSNPGKG